MYKSIKLIALFAFGLTSCEHPQNRYLGHWKPIQGNYDSFEIRCFPKSADPAVYYGTEYVLVFNSKGKPTITFQYFPDADLMIGATSKAAIYRMDCIDGVLRLTSLDAGKEYPYIMYKKSK